MIEKKVFILSIHKAEVDLLKENLKRAAEELNLPIKIDSFTDRPERNLPSCYDVYFLHLSQLEDVEEIRRLREKAKGSYIMGLAGATYCLLRLDKNGKLGKVSLKNWFDYENLKEVFGGEDDKRLFKNSN